MKIVFFLGNAQQRVDCRHLEQGNPGIGGTEYIIQATVLYLKRLQSDLTIVLAAQRTEGLAPELDAIPVNEILDCTRLEADLIVFKYEPADYQRLTRALREQSVARAHTRLIPWCHNFVRRQELTLLARDSRVARIVCVSEEQLQLYRDHKAFLKSTYIYNGMPTDYLQSLVPDLQPLSARPHDVTYVGSIVPYKGFHLLAQAWPEVLRGCPDAHLHVIGSGKLYDHRAQMGRYGIAEASYEARFMPYLTNEQGEILPSVTFHGVLGTEKNAILAHTRVGVPNPSGISETFCVSALEMQALGALVTTINYGGFRNTVYRTGLLYDDPRQLASSILTQLRQDDNDLPGFYQFMSQNFAFAHTAQNWLQLFQHLYHPLITPTSYLLTPNSSKSPNSSSRELNRRLKSHLGYWLPTIDFYQSIWRRIKRLTCCRIK